MKGGNGLRNREQTGEFSFKFTYRFTEERFQNAQECR